MLLTIGISPSCKLKDFNLDESFSKLKQAFNVAETIIDDAFLLRNKVRQFFILLLTGV